MAKAKKNGKVKLGKVSIKSKVSFKTWAATIARGRGEKAAKELADLRKAKAFDRPTAFPVLLANFTKYCARGSQSKAA